MVQRVATGVDVASSVVRTSRSGSPPQLPEVALAKLNDLWRQLDVADRTASSKRKPKASAYCLQASKQYCVRAQAIGLCEICTMNPFLCTGFEYQLFGEDRSKFKRGI